MRITSEKQLRRALCGSRTTSCAFLLLLVALLCFTPGYLYESRNNSEFPGMVIVFVAVIAITAFLLHFQNTRIRAARASLKQLKKYGELEEALADLAADDNHVYETFYPNSKEHIEHAVLTKRFLFMFSRGIVMPYYQIASLHVSAENGKLTLRMTDTCAKKHEVISGEGSSAGDIRLFIRELGRRYPGCPPVGNAGLLGNDE